MGTTKIPSCNVSSTLQKGTITLFHRGSTPLVLNCINRCQTGMLQMFRTTSFRMITESPGRIGAAQSWSSITFLLKPLHHKTGFLSVTFAVIYSSLLRFVFCVRCFLAPDSFRLYHPMRGCQDLHGRKIYFSGDFFPAVCRAIFSFAFSGISSRANS